MEDAEGRLWWEPEQFYHPTQDSSFAVILLNEALSTSSTQFVKSIWQKANVRVCVDGATNQYHQYMRSAELCIPLPDMISGDFDSAKPELLKLYGSLGVEIIPTPDQNETDFTKAVRELAKVLSKKNVRVNHVVVLAGINNNRFDHVIANLATLYKVEHMISAPVVVLSGQSIFWLLSAGDHTIQVAQNVILNLQNSWCGLAPLGHPSTVSTTGLKWNLDNQVMGFGHLVSTSNTYDLTQGGVVTVKTSHSLLWTMGFAVDSAEGEEEDMEDPNLSSSAKGLLTLANGTGTQPDNSEFTCDLPVRNLSNDISNMKV